MGNTVGKICKKCKSFQGYRNFSKDKYSSDKHQKWCKTCWHTFHQYDLAPLKRQQRIIIFATWSKYATDNNKGLKQEKVTPRWFCQGCMEEQTAQLPPYMFEYPQGEYIRICSKCHYKRLRYDIHPFDYPQLLALCRSSL